MFSCLVLMLEVSITLDVSAIHVFQAPPWQPWCIFHFSKWHPHPTHCDLVTLRPSGGVSQEWLMEGIVVSHLKGCVTVTLLSTLSWYKRKCHKKSFRFYVYWNWKRLDDELQNSGDLTCCCFFTLHKTSSWVTDWHSFQAHFHLAFARVCLLRRPAVCDSVSEVQPRRCWGLESYPHSITVRSPLTLS